MTSIVIFALEGVLQTEGGRPAEAGCRLYRTLRNSLLHQVGVISAADQDTARRFFDHQHLAAPTFIIADTAATALDWAIMCPAIRRGYPYDIDWIITPDPEIAAQLYHDGFRAMLWMDPRYARPEWRPDAGPHEASSWAALADGLREDKDLIANDERLG